MLRRGDDDAVSAEAMGGDFEGELSSEKFVKVAIRSEIFSENDGGVSLGVTAGDDDVLLRFPSVTRKAVSIEHAREKVVVGLMKDALAAKLVLAAANEEKRRNENGIPA